MRDTELDVIGQYYTSINNGKSPGVFALTVCLKEFVNPQILQRAANDLMRRLPFMNGRVVRGFFHYKYEALETFAQVVSDCDEPLFTDYYNKGSRHMIKVVHGPKHFTVKTTHSICDGRGLSKFTRALTVRYFELMGVKIADKGNVIDCGGTFHAEEAEDANKRYSNPPAKIKAKMKMVKTYRAKFSKSSPQRILTRSFDAGRVKRAAKAHDVTITEYILARIFSAAAKERDTAGEKGQITASVPIDCRSFFPSKTLRSFVAAEKIIMPEAVNFHDMARQVKTQFKKITAESVREQIYEHQNMYNMARFVPRVVKTLFMKLMSRFEAAEVTTGLSNLGLIKLPAEIENRIERMEFPICLEREYPHFFSCVTIGNVLTLTATFREEGRELVEAAMNAFG